MKNLATPEATGAYASKHPEILFNRLGATGLSVGPAGFGSYRVHITSDQQQQALREALSKGVNLIDSSANYGDGGAEEMIGAVMKTMIAEGKISREEIVLVTKAGYIQGQNLKVAAGRERAGNPFPEVVVLNNNLAHCIHPDYLSDQLERSLRRLQMKSVDFFLLHNPEYYFYEAEQKHVPKEEARTEFYRRIEQAFTHLELLADEGKIAHYGVSANSLPLSPENSHFVDIGRLWEIAEALRPDHHFRMVQFPMNLLEPQAALHTTQPGGKTLLQFAMDKKLAVLINRPLNAFKDDQLQRLVSIRLNSEFDEPYLEKTLEEVVKLEEDFASSVIKQINLESEVLERLAGLFATGTYLARHFKTMASYWSWLGQHAHFLSEQVSYAVQQVNEAPDKPQQVLDWLDAYVTVFNEVLDQLTRYYGREAERFSDGVLQRLYPKGETPASLTRVALQALWDTPGVSSVLIGMRRPEYVTEIMAYLQSKDGLQVAGWKEMGRGVK